MILIDSNIMIDVLGDDQSWQEWSVNQLDMLSDQGGLFVNQIVYAEVAPRLGSLDEFAARLDSFEIEFLPFAEDASFAAGSAFLTYRNRRESARLVLPDFFIGGHAQALGATILTRDPRFYRAYFPSVPLITPENPHQ